MTTEKDKIKETITKFCDLMLEKYKEVNFTKIIIGLNNKSKIKFKKYREDENKN